MYKYFFHSGSMNEYLFKYKIYKKGSFQPNMFRLYVYSALCVIITGYSHIRVLCCPPYNATNTRSSNIPYDGINSTRFPS